NRNQIKTARIERRRSLLKLVFDIVLSLKPSKHRGHQQLWPMSVTVGSPLFITVLPMGQHTSEDVTDCSGRSSRSRAARVTLAINGLAVFYGLSHLHLVQGFWIYYRGIFGKNN